MSSPSFPNTVTAADFPDVRWHGNWIWCDPPARPGFGPGMGAPVEPPTEKHALFCKTFQVNEVPGRVPARIAPHLGDLAWAEGKIPSPHGLISVRVEPGSVEVDSPVPVIVELPGKSPQRLPAGQHKV